jgi:CBS-domain-containing membrane protein
MTARFRNEELAPPGIDLTDEDIYEAMKRIPGYLDITPGDFKELYCLAFQHAIERITRSIMAKDIMTRRVIAVSPATPVPEVAEIMGREGISGVPVADPDGRVVGVISEKNFLALMGVEPPKNFMAVVATCLKTQKCHALTVRVKLAADIMSAPAITVGEEASHLDIARLLTDKGINRVPVVDQEGRLLGIVSRADIVRTAHASSCGITHP